MTTHWSLKRLGDIFEIARGGSPRPIEKFITNDPEGLNWIKIGDASAGGKFIKRTKEKIKHEGLSKTRLVHPGAFLLTNSMSFGRPYIMAIDGCIHDGWLVLTPRVRELIHPDYFYYLLGSDEIYRQFASRAGGSTVKNLNTEIVASVEVRLPPLDEQRRIAAILDKADALRRKRKSAIDSLRGLRESFVDAAVQGGTNGIIALGNALRFLTSGGRNWSKLYSESGVRFIRSLDVRMNGISEDDIVFVDPPDNAEARRTRTEEGDVLLTITGSRIGRVSALPDDLIGSHVSQHVAILRLEQSKLRPKYLSSFLGSTAGQRQIKKWQYGQTKPGLNFTQIESFEVPDIPIEQQIRFEDAMSRFDISFGIQNRHLEELHSLFSSLQFRAFSGQL